MARKQPQMQWRPQHIGDTRVTNKGSKSCGVSRHEPMRHATCAVDCTPRELELLTMEPKRLSLMCLSFITLNFTFALILL